MAFDSANLIRIGGGSGQNLWYYSTTEAQTVVDAASYFDDAANMLNVNDVIICITATGGTPVVTHAYVNANDGSTVDIVNGVAITATDSR
jgi:N-acetylmuramic acid 6-phosphate (MurNAc-6-P) etherase